MCHPSNHVISDTKETAPLVRIVEWYRKMATHESVSARTSRVSSAPSTTTGQTQRMLVLLRNRQTYVPKTPTPIG